jgi:WD40 repeat protein
MKRLFLILVISLFSMAYGCSNTMKAVEDDMSSLLRHMEVDSLSSSESAEKGSAGQDAAAPSASSASLENNSYKTTGKTHSLTIQVSPKESTIQVMNIKSRYSDGIRLAPGKYDILVKHKGYKSYREWVTVEYDVIVKVILKKESEAYMARSFDSNSATSKAAASGDAESAGSSESIVFVDASEKMNIEANSGLDQFPSKLTGHYGLVSSLCFSPDGSLLASGSYDSIVILWKINDGSVVHHLNHKDRVAAVAFSPAGNIVVSAGTDKTIKLWDVNTGELLQTFTGHTSRIHSVSFDLSGRILVSGGDNELIIWDADTGKIKNLIVGDDKLYPRFGAINKIVFNPNGGDADGYEFAFSCFQGIALFNPETKQLVKLDDQATPHSVAYSPDGKYIAWGARHHYKNDFFPRVVFSNSKQKDSALSRDDELAKADRIFYTAYTPAGNQLVMLTYSQVVLYDIQSGMVIEKFNGTSETAVTAAALSPDGHILAASAKDEIKIWKID